MSNTKAAVTKKDVQWFLDKIGTEIHANNNGQQFNPFITDHATATALFSQQQTGTLFDSEPIETPEHEKISSTPGSIDREQIKVSFFKKLGMWLKHIANSEREAQYKAQVITTRIKALLLSGEVLEIENILNAEKCGAEVVAVVNELIQVLSVTQVAENKDAVNALLGRYGAILTATFHEGTRPEKCARWIAIFEQLFSIVKQFI